VDTLGEVLRMEEFDIKALNFSTYGASFVHLDVSGKPLTPLYNYLKKFPEDLSNQFYEKYDGKISFSLETASPVLGNLNSGLQLYFLKQAKSGLFEKINHSLHLPQYLSYLVTGKFCSELTSIGCHTALWNFAHKEYHDWVFKEGIHHKLSRIVPSDSVVPVIYQHKSFYCGIGLHDSSAALIPYLTNFTEPFVLISTGTWCISLNPFNDRPLTKDELRQDCLCYISYKGEPVKASRLFAGYEHEQQTKRLAAHFMVAEDYFTTVSYQETYLKGITSGIVSGNISGIADNPGHEPVTDGVTDKKPLMTQSVFGARDLGLFSCYEEAYHRLISDLVHQQTASTQLVLGDGFVKNIFVDGGFSKNPVYMHLLAAAFPSIKVFAATIAQASAIGAALAIHKYWNSVPVNKTIIQLQPYN
jgi:sugar (pentulose or hexulose) kinase